MSKPRKLNLIELYYNEHGTKEDKSTNRLFPQGNYQTWVYFNSKVAEPDSVIFMTIALGDQEDAFAGIPMFNVGSFEKDGEIYQRWEAPLPNIAYEYFRKDTEVPLWFQFVEEEPGSFGGIYQNVESIPEGYEEGTYVYLLDEGAIYELVTEPDTWEEATSILQYGQVFGYDITKVYVAKGLRLNKEEIDPDLTQTILQYLALFQSKLGGIDNLQDIEGESYSDIVSFINALNETKVKKSGDTMSGNLTMDGNKVNEVGVPTDGGDATNKAYVDGELLSHETDEQAHEGRIKQNEEDIVSLDGRVTETENFIGTVDDTKLSRDGSQEMLGDLNMDGNSIQNVDEINQRNVDNAIVQLDEATSINVTQNERLDELEGSEEDILEALSYKEGMW